MDSNHRYPGDKLPLRGRSLSAVLAEVGVASALSPAADSYPPELRLTRQKGCIGDGSRVADIVVGMGETTMCAVAIRDDISPQELRRRARQESDGRVAARLFAIANALEGMDRAGAAWLAGMDRQTLRDWGSSLQRGRHCRAQQPTAAGALAEVDGRADGSAEGGS